MANQEKPGQSQELFKPREVENAATEVQLNSIWERLDKDPEVQAARKAIKRTLINAAITTVDTIPYVGEPFSLAADALKSKRISKFLGIDDLTPDVKKSVAWTTELLEIFGLIGVPVPSHGIESSMQFFGHDLHRIQAGLKAIKKILEERKTIRGGQKNKIDSAKKFFK